MGLTNFVKGLFHQEEVASTSQLQLQADSGGLVLTLPAPVYLLAKQGGGDELSMHQFLRMQILLEQGLARETENGICLEAEEAVSLDEDTRYILNLPAPWPGSFKLAVTGLSTRPDFILRLHLLAIDGELIRQYRLDGPLLYLSAAETYLPDPLQWQALSAIARHSALPGRDEYANLSAVHQLAQAADAGLRIDRAVFQSFQTLSPEKVGLTVEVQTDGSLELAPSFGSELNQESVAARLGQLDPRGEAQSLRVGKTLVLLDEQRLRAAHEIIRKRHIPARLRRKFFAAPGSFLDAALVDLDSGFSMRVKGVGPFQHAYFGETDSSDIEWFEQGENAEPELEPAGPADEFPGGLMEPQDLPGIITGPEILEDFKVKLEDAHTTNANVVKLDDCYVNIADRPRVRDAVTQLDEVFKNPPAEKAGPIAVDIHLNDTTADFGTEIQAPDKRIQADVEIDFSQYSRQPFPHQIEAVRWLLALACDKTKETKDRKITGALLADDMGLGKTYTTIVGMREILLQAETRKPVLIVAPLSLLENWKREINDTYKEPFFGRIVILQADGDLPKFRITGMSVETFSRMPRHKEAEAKPSEPPAQAGAEEDIGETEKISFKKPSSAPLPWEESEKISPQEDFLKKGIEEQVNLDSRVRGNDDTEASQVNLDSRVRGNDDTEASQVNLDSRVRGNDGTEASQVDLDSRVRGNDDTEASQVSLDSRVRGNDGAEASQVDLDSRVRGNDGTEASQVDLDSRVRGNDGAEDPWEGARRSLKIGPDWGPERLDLPDTLVLTTYQTLRDYQFSLAGIPWSVAIFDEAQNIKSPNTLQSRASKALNADFKLMVTGTPVENHLGEFWCLFDTLQPGFLGSYQDFRQNYIRPILKAPPNEAHQVREEIGRDLRERVGGFMLRRVKEDHLQNLPKKYIILGDYNEYGDFVFDERVVESMRGEQRALYEDVVNVTVDGMDRDEAAGMALCGLQQLRNVSLHPGLLREMPRLPATAEDAREICRQSGKLATLLRILDSIRERNEKVLIFIVNKRLQEMISVCVSRIYGVPTAIINGATKAVSKNANNLTRQGIIDQFQAAPGFNVLVLSPVAAGVGLTITAANNVIHLERHWNPAKEAQATDRAYRIGQTRDVYVYVPILLHPDLDSFDVNLNRLLTGKTSLKDAIITQEEVHTADFAQSGMFQQKCASSERRVNIEDADGLSEELFTALIAEIHARDAEQVLLKEGTHDVAVLSKKTGNMLIRCKKALGATLPGAENAIQEITRAKGYYEERTAQPFPHRALYSNVKKYSAAALEAAKFQQVRLYTRKHLEAALKQHEIAYESILRRNISRMNYEL